MRYKFPGRNGPVRWPACSHDLSPLDFYFWGHMKTLVYFRDIDKFKQQICYAVDTIKTKRDVCVDSKGKHFQHFILFFLMDVNLVLIN